MNSPDDNVCYSYSSLLKENGVEYVEDEAWLYHGKGPFKKNWTIYISMRTDQAITLLKVVIPFLSRNKLPFRLVKDELQSLNLNSGILGFTAVGKFLSIYTKSENQAIEIVNALNPIMQGYIGPAVPDALRIGKNIYGLYAAIIGSRDNKNGSAANFVIPPKSSIPFKLDRYYPNTKAKKMYGKWYFKIKDLRPGPKGDIFLALNLKRLSFKPVVVKEGRYGVLEDGYGRTIKDRLLWQRRLLEEIGPHLPTAKFVDYFEQDDNCYLVIDYIDGTFLPTRLDEIMVENSWSKLSTDKRIRLLKYYMQILRIVKTIHQLGIVFRDIQDNNFIVTKDDKVHIIDFELAYKLSSKEPDPPFLYGTHGYISPEQINGEAPDPSTDIYSLGALLAFIISGEHPSTFINEDIEGAANKLRRISADDELARIFLECTHSDPKKRLVIDALITQTQKYSDSILRGLAVESIE